MHGFEMGEFLTRGAEKSLSLMKVQSQAKAWLILHGRWLIDWFIKKGVKMISDVRSMPDNRERAEDSNQRRQRGVPKADNIVPAVESTPDTTLLKPEEKVPEVYAVGDCKDPGMIVDAIGSAYQIANTI